MAQTNFTPILTYKSDTTTVVPSAGNLTNSANGAELAVNTADKRLFTKDSGGSVVELGTNPSSITLPNATANGVAFANGSKVLTTGSALTFDGTSFGVGGSTTRAVSGYTFINAIGNSNGAYTDYYAGATRIGSVGVEASLLGISTNGNLPITFDINGSEQMRLTSTGLGIGTSSPTRKLQVNANQNGVMLSHGFNLADYSEVTFHCVGVPGSGAVIRSYRANTIFTGNEGDLRFYTNPGTNTSSDNAIERMRLDSSGNLGLGVTPSAWQSTKKAFQIGAVGAINGDSATVALSNNAYIDSSGTARYLTTSTAAYYYQNSGQHAWFNAPSGTANDPISFTQAMALDASGNLLVGKTSTANSAAGLRLFNDATDGGQIRFTRQSGSSTQYAAYFYESGGGLVGSISTTSAATAYNTSSDYRLKNTIAPMTGALAKVALLKPCTYKWNADGSDGEGFIAHELAEVVPQCVTGQKDAVDAEGKPQYQGIDTSFLVATLTAAIQEQQAIIESLKARLDAANL